jgi:hypothetical protein
MEPGDEFTPIALNVGHGAPAIVLKLIEEVRMVERL